MLVLYLALPVGAVLMTVFLTIGIVGGSHHLTPREQAEREKADAEGVSPGVGID